MVSGYETVVARLDRLERELGEVRHRLASLEGRSDSASSEPLAIPVARITPATDGHAPASDAPGFAWLSGSVALTGRTFLVLAGSFLLRAFTDGGYLPASVGIAVGLVYASFWLLGASGAARRGQLLSANFHGFAAAATAFPLLWETTVRMGQLSTEASAVLLVAFFTAGLALAWYSNLPAIAWITTLFALATTFGLLFATRALATYGLVLVLLAAWTQIISTYDRWPGLRLLPTLGAGAAVLLCADLLAGPRGLPPEYPSLSFPFALSVALLLPAIYVASLLFRTVWRQREVTLAEAPLVLVALASGLGAGAWMLVAQQTAPTIVGALSLLLSAGCYAATWKSTVYRTGGLLTYHTLASLGLLLAVAGTAMLLNGSALALLWSLLAIVLGSLGGRYRLAMLSVHGSAFILAATLASGLAVSAWDALAASASDNWRPVTPAGYAAVAAAAIGYGLLLPARLRSLEPRSDLLRSLPIAAILGWAVAGLIVWGLAGFAGAPGRGADAAALATLRTAVVASLTVGLSGIGSRWARHELTWLAYALLVLGAAKLLFEDLRFGQPATLFVSLAFYGGALILTSRLVRRAAPQRSDAVGSSASPNG